MQAYPRNMPRTPAYVVHFLHPLPSSFAFALRLRPSSSPFVFVLHLRPSPLSFAFALCLRPSPSPFTFALRLRPFVFVLRLRPRVLSLFPCYLHMSSNINCLAKVEETRCQYEKGLQKEPSPTDQQNWNLILDGNFSKLSSGRKSISNRAHKAATTILAELGQEVLVLVLSSLNRTQLSRLHAGEELIMELHKWWNTVPHPPALSKVTKSLFERAKDDAAILPGISIHEFTPATIAIGRSAQRVQAFRFCEWKSSNFCRTCIDACSDQHPEAARSLRLDQC
jgi:hypothetical protein